MCRVRGRHARLHVTAAPRPRPAAPLATGGGSNTWPVCVAGRWLRYDLVRLQETDWSRHMSTSRVKIARRDLASLHIQGEDQVSCRPARPPRRPPGRPAVYPSPSPSQCRGAGNQRGRSQGGQAHQRAAAINRLHQSGGRCRGRPCCRSAAAGSRIISAVWTTCLRLSATIRLSRPRGAARARP